MLLTKNNRMKLLIWTFFAMSYYTIFGLTSFASGMLHDRITISFPFESQIPFYPAWAIVYLSINLLLFLALFIFREWKPLAAFAMTLLIETFIAGVCFIILPSKLNYFPVTIDGSFSTIVYIAKFFSMNDNYFPSLHTAFAFTAAFSYSRYCSKIAKVGLYVWACAISLSTLLIHEHQIADLIAGFILALIAHRYIFPFSNLLILRSPKQQLSEAELKI